MRGVARLVAAFAGWLAASGCKEPDVQVKSVHAVPERTTPQDLALDVEVIVTNNESADAKVRRLEADVVLGGRYKLRRIVETPEQWVYAKHAATFTLHVRVPWDEVPWIGADVSMKKRLDYQVKGTVWLLATSTFEKATTKAFAKAGSIPQSEIVRDATAVPPIPVLIPIPLPLPMPVPTM